MNNERRQQTHAHCHRQETRKTPDGDKRIVTVNANLQPDGTISRDAFAHDRANSHRQRSERRTTTERTSTDLVYDARTRRTNRVAHQQKQREEERKLNQKIAQDQLDELHSHYGEDDTKRPLILD